MNWCRPDSGSTENERVENRKLFKNTLSCCTYVFHRCRLVLAFSVLAFSTLAYSYLRIPYLHNPSSGTFVFRTCVFSRPIPAASALSARAFSVAGGVCNRRRASLSPQHLNALVFINANSDLLSKFAVCGNLANHDHSNW